MLAQSDQKSCRVANCSVMIPATVIRPSRDLDDEANCCRHSQVGGLHIHQAGLEVIFSNFLRWEYVIFLLMWVEYNVQTILVEY